MGLSSSEPRLSPAPAVRDAAIPAGYRIGLYLVAAAAMLSPLWWARVPPLVDYPNHLARMWILVHGDEIPALAANYTVHWRILPDLGMDLVVFGLSRVMPVEEAGRLFIALTMLALLGGTVTLHRVLHGRWGLWPLCAVLFVYNAALFWGFVSCLFAIGAYFFAFAAWMASAHWRTAPRIAIFSVIAGLLLLLHLFAFGLYALSLATYEMGLRLDRCRISLAGLLGWAATLLQLIPGFVLWWLSLAHGGAILTLYGGWREKLHALLAPFMFDWLPTDFDRLFAVAMCVALVLAIATRSLKLAPSMRLPLAALVVTVLLMPNRMSGGWNADIRLPVTLPFLIIASTRPDIARNAVTRTFAAAALVLFGLRIWSVSQSWYDYNRWFDEFRRASAAIAPGARLLVVEASTPDDRRRLPGVPAFFATLQPAAFIHMGALAVIDRAAFFPYMFTGWTTIDVAPKNRSVSEREGIPASPDQLTRSADPPRWGGYVAADSNAIGELPYWRRWPKTFDFVLWIDFGADRHSVPGHLRLLRRGSFFEIYRVLRL